MPLAELRLIYLDASFSKSRPAARTVPAVLTYTAGPLQLLMHVGKASSKRPTSTHMLELSGGCKDNLRLLSVHIDQPVAACCKAKQNLLPCFARHGTASRCVL